jgi:hypothetical protein
MIADRCASIPPCDALTLLSSAPAGRCAIQRSKGWRRIGQQAEPGCEPRDRSHVRVGEHGGAGTREMTGLRQHRSLHRRGVLEVDAVHLGAREQRIPAAVAWNGLLLGGARGAGAEGGRTKTTLVKPLFLLVPLKQSEDLLAQPRPGRKCGLQLNGHCDSLPKTRVPGSSKRG